MILHDFLTSDVAQFCAVVDAWDPSIYNLLQAAARPHAAGMRTDSRAIYLCRTRTHAHTQMHIHIYMWGRKISPRESAVGRALSITREAAPCRFVLGS